MDFTAIGLNSVAGLAAQGKLRPLAVAARQRLAPSTPQALLARVQADVALVRPLVDEGRIARL